MLLLYACGAKAGGERGCWRHTKYSLLGDHVVLTQAQSSLLHVSQDAAVAAIPRVAQSAAAFCC